MAKNSKKALAVLTSGGDAPGMNAVIRAAVRTGIKSGYRMIGIKRGFSGLLSEDFVTLDTNSVSNIIERGGTILNTARCLEFREEEYQQKAADICRENGIEGVIVCGGDGSFRGAKALFEHGVNVTGVPCTIDLDIQCTEYTIGFDTAVNTAMEAIDKIRDTSASHERCSIIEVMGRSAGYIALWCGIASGAEEVLIPELYDGNEQNIIDRMTEAKKKGKKHFIIVNAEGVGGSQEMAKRIENATGIETRATILGYMQRGGSPSCRDRVIATMMGERAAELLVHGHSNRIVCWRAGRIFDMSIGEAFATTKAIPDELVRIPVSLKR